MRCCTCRSRSILLFRPRSVFCPQAILRGIPARSATKRRHSSVGGLCCVLWHLRFSIKPSIYAVDLCLTLSVRWIAASRTLPRDEHMSPPATQVVAAVMSPPPPTAVTAGQSCADPTATATPINQRPLRLSFGSCCSWSQSWQVGREVAVVTATMNRGVSRRKTGTPSPSWKDWLCCCR